MRGALAPSILSFDVAQLASALPTMAEAGAEVVHLDIMDGQFVPPISFGDALVANIRPLVPTLFEAHLMTLTPEHHFEAFARAGCQRVIFHAEATFHAHRLAQTLRSMGLQAGLAINPGTPVEVVEPLLDELDLVLVMTVNPGWGGQRFIPATLDKIRRLRAAAPDILIEVDGGIDPSTLPIVLEAGANLFVVGSYLARSEDLGAAVRGLRALCE
jgi:ribulose-phosphate 3-epimerase